MAIFARRPGLTLFYLWAIVASLCLPWPVQGQELPDWLKLFDKPPDPNLPRPYVNIPLPTNLSEAFRARLMAGKENEQLRQFLDQIIQDPKHFGIDPKLLKKADLDNPFTKMVVRQWVQATNGKMDRESAMLLQWQLQEAIKIKAQYEASGAKLPFDPNNLGPMPSLNREDFIPPRLPKKLNDPLAKLVNKALRKTEGSGLNDYLQQSKGWQKGLAQLQGLDGGAASSNSWDEWVDQWGLADRLPSTWSDQALDSISKLSLPDISRGSWELPSLSPEGGWSAPNLEVPGFADSSSAITGVETFLLLGLAAGMLLCAWKFFQGSRRARTNASAIQLGPWPVDPGKLSTRAQLIAAFEYLARLRLGEQVTTWNHRLIAAALAAPASPQGQAADQLGRIYEQARYTEGAETLSAADQNQARQAFALLAAG